MTQKVEAGIEINTGDLYIKPINGNKDLGITGAQVGQIAKITTVDDTGKPTAWEAVDMPSGGTFDHTMLKNRNAVDQHTMSAITGLTDALAGKQPIGNYLTEESDPTVPEWAKQPHKPSYTAQEIGALPATTHIPSTADDVAEGASYTTTLSPTGTYKKLGAIIVTMGGADISVLAVSGNTVSIANVTGDITITCAAAITNIIDTVGISANTRLSASSGANKAQAGYAAIGANMDASSMIHLRAGDTLRIKGASLPTANNGNSVAAAYSAAARLVSTGYIHNGCVWNGLNFTSSGDIVTVTTTGEHYIRISLICTDASAVIATINEPIT